MAVKLCKLCKCLSPFRSSEQAQIKSLHFVTASLNGVFVLENAGTVFWVRPTP